jgi:endoglucanase Acf2
MRPLARALALLLPALSLPSHAALVRLGEGAYLDQLPAGKTGAANTSGARVLPRVVPGNPAPPPTGDWWSSLIFPRDAAQYPHGTTLFAWPLTLQARASGMGVGAADPGGASGGTEYHWGHTDALVLGLEGLSSPSVQAVSWGDWHVVARLSDATRSMDVTFGHGMPFAYVTSSGADASVVCRTVPVVWSGAGTNTLGITVAGNHYALFAPTGATWTLSGSTIRSSLAGKGYWSAAVLPDATPSTLDRFRRSAFAFPTATRVDWSLDAPAGRVRARYSVTSSAKEGPVAPALQALFRHQWLLSPDVNTSWSYRSARGSMKVVDGDAFTTSDAVPPVIPSLPDLPTADQPTLAAELDAAVATNLLANKGSDTYWAGKGLWRAASLVRLADQLGKNAVRDTLLSRLKSELQEWLTATEGKTVSVFAYDAQWKTLIGFPAGYGSDVELNDHHFHYAYFLMAAAVVAQYDPAWARRDRWGAMVELLVRDANNPRRDDPSFPFLRQFDPYEGHSWASGHSHFLAGNNQESNSESMLFNSALALWGMATGNDSLRDAGLWMTATETRALEQYWWDVDDAVFPASWPYHAVGMIWGNGAAHATWFSGEPECIHGINTLPFTATSVAWTKHPSHVRKLFAEMVKEKKGGVLDTWTDVMMAYAAIGNPDSVWNVFQTWNGVGAEGGVTKPWYRHWLGNLRTRGALDTTVSADHPAAIAMRMGNLRTWMAWNPDSVPATVRFTDGKTLMVPARKMAWESGTPPVSVHRVAGRADAPRALVGIRALSGLGSRSVEVQSLDGRTVYRGPANNAHLSESVWFVRTLDP